MSWEPLSSGDPLAGDPDGIDILVRNLRSYGQEFQSAGQEVSSIAATSWTGPAADQFKVRQEAIAPKLATVANRLLDTANALGSFSQQLRGIQTEAASLCNQAWQVEGELVAVQPLANAQRAHNHKQQLGVALGKPPVPWTGPNYIQREGQFKRNLASLRQRFDGLVGEYQSVAGSCARTLGSISHDGLQNNIFSVLGHYGGNVEHVAAYDLHELKRAADIAMPYIARLSHDLANVTGILALILPPPFDAVAGVIFLAAMGVALASDVYLASEHKISWSNVGWDAFGIALAGAGNMISHVRAVASGAEKATTTSGAFRDLLVSAPKVKEGQVLTPIDAKFAREIGLGKHVLDGLNLADDIQPYPVGLISNWNDQQGPLDNLFANPIAVKPFGQTGVLGDSGR